MRASEARPAADFRRAGAGSATRPSARRPRTFGSEDAVEIRRSCEIGCRRDLAQGASRD